MEKIFCILGKSSAGKDSLVNAINKDLGIPIATSFTTRPLREGETDGVEYNFIDQKNFWDLHGAGALAEYTSYHVADDEVWYYGLTKEELEKSNYVMVIVNPHGLHQLKDIYGDKVISVLIECDGRERLIRSLMRDNKAKAKEICRRFLSDEDDFKDIQTNYIIENIDGKRTSREILKETIMKEILKKEKK